ncbi:hypothetical protein ACTWPT_32915 [Nonomuraea sp. 3N208]
MSTEILRLLGRMAETWNAAGYAALFTPDADYITFFCRMAKP